MLGKPKEEGLEFEARSPCIVRPHVNKQIKTKGLACNSESESVLKDLILHGRNKPGSSPSPPPLPRHLFTIMTNTLLSSVLAILRLCVFKDCLEKGS